MFLVNGCGNGYSFCCLPLFLRDIWFDSSLRRIATGTDIAGEVVQAGPGVTGFGVGEKVVAWLDLQVALKIHALALVIGRSRVLCCAPGTAC